MTNSTESHSSEAASSAAEIHIASPLMLIGVFAGLLALTAITLAASSVDMGSIVNFWLALVIAAAQASLMAVYFMQLRWDNLFHGVVLVAAAFFVALFIGIAVLDSKEYQSTLAPPPRVAPHP
ncbi:MAG TPA: cytochrome C oxidase subunit IV family protein [Tepidisphaeraceae bacterium]|jgi:caa(3)-type oxidase subunit IV